ncbi:MAG: asparagine synthase (glutamine-hydrolyzing) [Candidatus Micrarchaeota archaeon]|nr:asparagine synthase (glutamine-hydrolyzing) [Candidatus Micrarchaeota archaeon]
MCGICGIFGDYSKGQIVKMTDSLVHRGPDSDGYFYDKNIALGFRRLSIIDLKTGNQPIYNEDETVAIVFNGEIYNYKELRLKLEARGHRFTTNTDTETIVHAYEEFGEKEFANMLNGMFAFAIYDSNKKKLILARDRVGIKPLYYALVGKDLVFGSEIKAVLAANMMKAEVDFDGFSSYMLFGTSFGDRTLVRGVKRLLPGHMLTYDADGVEIRKFAKPGKIPEINPASLRKILEESVKSQMVADVPVGAFLSGGLDSSAVTALMKRSNDNLKTFNIGFGREDDESRYAKAVAEHIGTDHHEVILNDSEVPKLLEEFIYYYDDLNWDAAALPLYRLSKYAKKYVTVVLAGEGGDELFGGYNRYKFFSNYFSMIPNSIRMKFYEHFLKMSKKSWRNNSIKKPSHYGEHIVNSYFSNGISLKNVLEFEVEQTLPNQLLVKADRATMAASLEGRVPLLDNRMLDFAMATPDNMKLKGLEGKYILRLAVKDLLPKITVKRAKQGFGASPHKWFEKKEFMDFAVSYLDDPHVKLPYYDNQFWKQLTDLKGIGTDKKKKGNTLWMMLCFEMWYRKFIED